ncbi:AsmA family protein [Mucilaginibacter lacusdianchii]|uniref:AsmA family protein n=1 Tax=Mucilaginibacter lacusdianchii TaxID=2684211 RepID=UPI00131BA285|nr:AsmA family protein [Mucilaginibacter sp. JXJ CY 39]
MPKWLKVLFKVLAVIVGAIILLFVGISIYISTHKAKVLSLINTELNKNLDGNLTIGDLQTSFFSGFPGISVSLKKVLVRDKRWAEHHHTLLDAQSLGVTINTASLFKGTVRISRIAINDASIDLYTDTAGYSNTSIFKKKNKQTPKDTSSGDSDTEFGNIDLNNVKFAVNNQQKNKLFQFDVKELRGKMHYPDSGWNANLQLKVLPQSFAFNTDRGSFLKNKEVAGQLLAGYNEDKGIINVESKNLTIGGDNFGIKATFNTGNKPTDFNIQVSANQILWRHASALLANNIAITLNKFNLEKPFAVKATIAGSFGGGDPKLNVVGNINNNRLTTPGGDFDNCSFDAQFTNEAEKGKGLTDENSVIKVYHFTGKYHQVPVRVDTGTIANLKKPIVTGNFVSNFPLVNLNELLGKDIAKFSTGSANLNLHFKADVVDYRLNKPIISGMIKLVKADATYIPRNLKFQNTSMSLGFINNDLVLSDMRVQSGHSVVYMQGRVKNFLNLYYNDPEKILLTWQIRSPELRVAEFLGFLNRRRPSARPVRRTANSTNIIDQLSNALDKGNAEMHVSVDKLYYKNFLATNVHANLLTYEEGIFIKDLGLRHAGGSLEVKGRMTQGDNVNRFAINTIISRVNVREFFKAFDNFGMSGFSYENLKGYLSAKAQLNGGITDKGSLLPRSLNGTVELNLQNAALLDFDPLIKVGKFAFPFRDLNNITIPTLNGRFDVRGEHIIIKPMQISSSVLNADVEGVYGLNKGTSIALDIPLRNPKKDEDITDEKELQERRYKGIVLHILAHDDENGKIKIGWNKNHK